MPHFLPRIVKPDELVRVNMAHPMARGIAAFWILARNRTFYDAVTQDVGIGGASQKVIATSEGSAIHCDGTAVTTSTTGFRADPNTTAGACTLIGRVRLTSLPGATCIAAGYNGTGGGFQNGGPIIGFNTSGNGGGGMTGGNNGILTFDSTAWLNKWVTLAGSALDSSHIFSYVNGVKQSVGSGSGALPNVPPHSITLGNNVQGYEAKFTGDVAWLIAVNRILNDDEQKFFALTPFDILEKRSKYYLLTPTSGGGSGINLAAFGLGAGRGSPSLLFSIGARGISQGRGNPAVTLNVGSKGTGESRGTLSTSVLISGRGVGQGRANPALTLQVAAKGESKGRAAAAMTARLSAGGVGQSKGRTAVSFLLSALGRSQGSGKLAQTLSIRARGAGMAFGFKSGAALLLLSARGTAMGFGLLTKALLYRLNPSYIAAATVRAVSAVAAQRSLVAASTPRMLISNLVVNQLSATYDLTPPIDAGVEQLTVTFDFGLIPLAPGVTITRVVSVTCVVSLSAPYLTPDSAAATRLLSPAIIGPSPKTGNASQAVLQLVGNMVGGCRYLLQCVVDTSDGQQPSVWTHLPCVTPS